MNLSEFKAWFEGFTENLSGDRPTEKQWKRIAAKVKEIKSEPTSYPVFVDRVSYTPLQGVASSPVQLSAWHSGWNSADAFTALGRAEANELANA